MRRSLLPVFVGARPPRARLSIVRPGLRGRVSVLPLGGSRITELPATGGSPLLPISGAAMLAALALLRRRIRAA